MKTTVLVHARATGEKRQAYTFETEYDITGRMTNKQQESFYFFIQGFIAGAFRKYTNEYRGLFVGDTKKARAPLDLPIHSRRIENFEVKIGDYRL